ncbi:MAG: hypothetical protein JRI78_12255 [Deltaproteobacteria bacterium]|nr:hypothetical protein [Deltaproteobacteria bacterium]
MNERYEQEFINIAILENVIEAQLIASILNEHNIPHRIQSFHDTAYDGLFQFQMGWGSLFAPLSNKKEIIEILNDVRSKFFDNQE